MGHFKNSAARMALLIGLLGGGSHAALAQTSEGASSTSANGGLADIVVTASRREAKIQDVPIAISAIGGDALRDRGISDPRQLSSLAPNLNVDQGISNGATHVSIRGLASTDYSLGASSPVATYVDDIYQPFQFGIGTQIYDLNRIEVLRGPQGTLFGKNTTGGALNYYSQTPTKRDEGYLTFDGGGGDYAHYSVEGAFNKPITNDLAARLSFRVDRRNNYVNNLYDGSKLGHYTNYNFRLQLAWTPSTDTTINLKLFGLRNSGDGPIYISQYYSEPCNTSFATYFRCGVNGGAPQSLNSRNTYSDVPTKEDYDNYGGVLKIDQSFGDYKLTSITGAQEGHYHLATNDDGSAADFFHSHQDSKTWQVSQELRLATPVHAPLRAVIGLFGQYDHINAVQGSGSTNIDQGGVPSGFENLGDTAAIQSTTTLAAFGSVTYEFNRVFSLVGGLRYSYEHKKIEDPGFFDGTLINPNVVDFQDEDINYYNALAKYGPGCPTCIYNYSDKHSWKKLTWDITGNIKPSDDILLYAKAATGFRSGGYPVGITVEQSYIDYATDPNANSIRLRPETLMAYELGFKTEWFDRKLRVNGSAFYSTYKNMQVQRTNSTGFGLFLANAGKSRIKGAELEVEAAPIRGLTLSGSLGYSKAKYLDYAYTPTINLAGSTLPYAPKWTGAVGASYETPVGDGYSLTIGSNWTYRSRIYFDPTNAIETSDPSRFIGNARISFGQVGKGWRLSAYVNNLTNLDMKAFSFGIANPDTGGTLFTSSIYAPKRTWGLQGSFEF